MSHRYDASLISGAHVYGSGSLGVLGSAIPSTGDSGAGYAYNDLSLPGDNAKEICGRITTWPTNGSLLAYEDTSFEYTALSDGADSFQYQLYVDGVATGSPTTVTLATGAIPVTISCALGAAIANGLTATLSSAFTLSTNLGTATASGHASWVSAPVTLAANLGTATASGLSASISAAGSTSISCTAGAATASGYTAALEAGFTLAVGLGTAAAAGHAATVTAGGNFSGSLSDTDIDRIVAAVLAALQATTTPVDVRLVKGADFAIWPTPTEISDNLLGTLM